MAEANHFVTLLCVEKVCRLCTRPATHRVREDFALHERDAGPRRFTYLCCTHFVGVFGEEAPCARFSPDIELARAQTRKLK